MSMLNNLIKVFSAALLTLILHNSCNKHKTVEGYGYSRVLYHFKDDALKYKAAKFLVENLSQYYSIRSRYITEDGKDYTAYLSTYDGPLKKENIQNRLGVYMDQKRIYDSVQVTPEFLIRSINEAFEVYNNKTLRRKPYSFQDFLEYVLPYRVGFEELNNWRGYMKSRYTSYLQSFDLKKLSQHKLALLINAEQNGGSNFSLSRLSYVTSPSINQTIDEILKVRVPFSCEDYAVKTLYALRAIGVPSAYEIIPLLGKFNNGHAQTSILNENDKFFSAIQDTNQFKYQIAKMYRRTFSRQSNPADLIEAAGEPKDEIPDYFNQTNYLDITRERTDVSTVNIECIPAIEKRVTYLCVYNNGEWHPVEWSVLRRKQHSSTFRDMGRKILYHLAVVANNGLQLLKTPFILDTLGQVIPIGSDKKPAINKMSVLNYDRHGAIKSGSKYVLYVWDNEGHGWSKCQHIKTTTRLATFKNIYSNQLYKIEPISEEINESVRPFTFENQQQIWW